MDRHPAGGRPAVGGIQAVGGKPVVGGIQLVVMGRPAVGGIQRMGIVVQNLHTGIRN